MESPPECDELAVSPNDIFDENLDGWTTQLFSGQHAHLSAKQCVIYYLVCKHDLIWGEFY
jgi:hypothetical protein